MTNREQVAWSFSFEEYESTNIADIVSDMMDAIGVYIGYKDRERLEKWLELECDPATNNWGVLEEDEDGE